MEMRNATSASHSGDKQFRPQEIAGISINKLVEVDELLKICSTKM
jgi:hypothetical protein